jgi:hypothetical protein
LNHCTKSPILDVACVFLGRSAATRAHPISHYNGALFLLQKLAEAAAEAGQICYKESSMAAPAASRQPLVASGLGLLPWLPGFAALGIQSFVRWELGGRRCLQPLTTLLQMASDDAASAATSVEVQCYLRTTMLL